MYIPPAFNIDDLARQHSLMRENSFATLVTCADGNLCATHIPLLLDAQRGKLGTLIGHVARANTQWQALRGESEVLAIFQGAHAYISPSWYAAQPAVPTWNYIAVHAYGRPRLVEDPARVRQIILETVNAYEGGFEKPWRLETGSDYIEKMLRQIVAFEIELTRIEAKAKLSQNRSLADRTGVIQALEASASPLDQDIARRMIKTMPPA